MCFAVAIVFSVLPRRPLAIGIDGSREADMIIVLPGQSPFMRLQQYYGYMAVGVAFSYAVNDEVHKNMWDNMTAADSLSFLLRWFDRFPEYKGRDFFIVGESNDIRYDLELIGNNILEYTTEQAELYEYLWQRSFISDLTHSRIAQNCKSPDQGRSGPDHPSTVCQAAKDMSYANTSDISTFNIYALTCYDKKVRATHSKCMRDLADPCLEYFVEAYFNHLQVEKAVHANTDLKYRWTRCRTRGGGPGRARTSTYNLWRFGDSMTMLPYIKDLADTGIRI
ncbi:hypothetical protein BRADI_1g06636v3 [Brachypodium distachyon]|uniref:Uncharacterized protein n=1 Tax=Brachypodium distachyon TaxID=15368 RepID=A0A0Q3GPD8_BRADI|nr:hypothetical protein BRADI_1g06636v3 [Brachypodium distachyon]